MLLLVRLCYSVVHDIDSFHTKDLILNSNFAFVILYDDYHFQNKKALGIFEALSKEYHNSINFFSINVEKIPHTLSDITIYQIPQISFHRYSRNIGYYLGEWNEKDLHSICEKMIQPSPNVHVLNSLSEYVKATHLASSAVVFYSPIDDPFVNNINEMVRSIDISVPVYHVFKSELAQEIGFESINMVQIIREFDGKVLFLKNPSHNEMKRRLRPFFTYVQNCPSFGSILDGWVLGAIINQEDYHQRNDVANMFQDIARIYGSGIKYHICDFMKCSNIPLLYGLSNSTIPYYFLFNNNMNDKLHFSIPYIGNPHSFYMIRQWMRKTIELTKIDRSLSYRISSIPLISAISFEELVYNNQYDSIVFFGDPSYFRYNLSSISIVNQVFKKSKRIKTYMFSLKYNLRPYILPESINEPSLYLFAPRNNDNPIELPLFEAPRVIIQKIYDSLNTSMDSISQKDALKFLKGKL